MSMKQVQRTLAGDDEVDRRRSLGKRVKQRSLGKRVKQSSLGQEGQAIKKSVSVMAAIKSWRGQATKSWQEGQAIKP